MKEANKTATLYSFVRPYQYVVFFNPRNAKLRAPEVRRALNKAINRDALIQTALRGHGTPSAGPVPLHHWAFHQMDSVFRYSPKSAAGRISSPLRLKCVTLSEQPFEQISLVMKQQLKAIGVELDIEGLPPDQVVSTLAKDDFDTVLLDYSSGWSVMRAIAGGTQEASPT